MISVIVPTYNREQYVPEAIQSILKQTWLDFELIVVDDASTDGTVDLVRAVDDLRLRLITLPVNGGPAAARNLGIEAARGEFIAFLDSDDFFLPEKLQKQVAYMNDHPDCGLCYCGYFVTKESVPGENDERPRARSIRSERTSLADLLLGPAFTFSSVLARKEWVEKVGGMDTGLRTGEEWDWLIRMALEGCSMHGIDEALLVKRVHPLNLVRSLRDTAERSLVVLNRAFSSSKMPEELQGLRPTAERLALARLCAFACVDSDLAAAADYCHRMLYYDEVQMGASDLTVAAQKVVGIVHGLILQDSERVLLDFSQQLEQIGSRERLFAKELRAQLYAAQTYEAFQKGNRTATLRGAMHYWKAASPRAGNRGIISMLVRSMLRGVPVDA